MKKVNTLVYFGSGGHTTEMIQLIRNLSDVKYNPIHFVLSETDYTSRSRVDKSECKFANKAMYHTVRRSREVKQSWITTIFTSLLSLIDCFLLICRIQPDLIISNGPGTCVFLCLSAYLLKVLRIKECKIVFVESFCRVKTLSLTGKILYPFVDEFIVQWKTLQYEYPKSKYLGIIC